MHLSYSEDILQRIRAQQSLSNTMNTFMKLKTPNNNDANHLQPPRYLSQISGSPSRIHQSNPFTPTHKRPITYNECINEEQGRGRGRYRLRNFRQSRFRESRMSDDMEAKMRSSSYNGLKEIMREEINKSSVKRHYDQVIESGDYEMVEKLKSDLLFLPSACKVPHRNRYRPNKKLSVLPANRILVNGSKLEDKQGEVLRKYEERVEEGMANFPQNSKRTAGYELKYRRNYLDKEPSKQPQSKGSTKTKQTDTAKYKQEEEQGPLTGWA